MGELRREVLKKVTGPKIATVLNKVFNVAAVKLFYSMWNMEDWIIRVDIEVNSSDFNIKSDFEGQKCRFIYATKESKISFLENWIAEHPDKDKEKANKLDLFTGAECSFGVVEYTLRSDPKSLDNDYRISLSHGKENYHVSIGICRVRPVTWTPSPEWMSPDSDMFKAFKILLRVGLYENERLAVRYGGKALMTDSDKCLEGLCDLSKIVRDNINEYLPH